MDEPNPQPPLVAELRTPAAAAVAGLLFSVILIAVLVLLHSSVPVDAKHSAEWATSAGARRAVGVATALIPFAGISFLWFIGVVRNQLGAREDKLFATVFLGSGLIFVAMLFVASSFLATLLTLVERGFSVNAESVLTLQVLTRHLMGTFAARMAAVFTISVSSVGLRSRMMPRSLVLLGYGAGLLLLLSPPISAWSQLVFPIWVLVFSIYILVVSRRRAG